MKVLVKIKNYIKDKIYALFPVLEYFHIYIFAKRGLKGLDNRLKKYLDKNTGFFIEVGGNDGITQSNTYYLEKVKKWQGILVEGIPELYFKCNDRRKNSKVYNYALVGNDFKEEYIEMEYANLMSVVENTIFDKNAHISAGSKLQGIDNVYKVKVRAKTLGEILEENKIEKVDFFSLDVEGFELEVLKGIDFAKVKIEYILIEIDDQNYKEEIETFLGNRYQLIDKLSYHDYLYKLV